MVKAAEVYHPSSNAKWFGRYPKCLDCGLLSIMVEFFNNLKLRHTLEERFGLYRGWAAHAKLAEFRKNNFGIRLFLY
jgi:hypothetical protein